MKLLAVNELEDVKGAGDLIPPGTSSTTYMPAPGGSYYVGQYTIYVTGGNIFIYSGYSYSY